MICGYKNIPVNSGSKTVIIGLSYYREGGQVEFLEGWINPLVAASLSQYDRLTYMTHAKRIFLETLDRQLKTCPDQERMWKGVMYG
jgi:hypothetical protein